VLKIDQSFIRDLSKDLRHKVALVRSMVTLSHEMGYRVVGEGVETQDAADVLRHMGCDEAQGYLFARPLEAGDFEQFLRDNGGFDYPPVVAA
jgi:EAL domain-containing protein (putative c-di-GMP-specific phosphodiesterase class I)